MIPMVVSSTWLQSIYIIKCTISPSILIQCICFINSCLLTCCLAPNYHTTISLRWSSNRWVHYLLIMRDVTSHLTCCWILSHIWVIVIGWCVSTTSYSSIFRVNTSWSSSNPICTTTLSPYMHLVGDRTLRYFRAW